MEFLRFVHEAWPETQLVVVMIQKDDGLVIDFVDFVAVVAAAAAAVVDVDVEQLAGRHVLEPAVEQPLIQQRWQQSFVHPDH